MPRRERPAETQRSEHWLRVAVNEATDYLNAKIAGVFGWRPPDMIRWLSPVKADDYAEYYDQAFLDRLELRDLRTPLEDFWPSSGPRWDGLAKTAAGKVILVEAKAYIEEAVDYRSRASLESVQRIKDALAKAKVGFGASPDAPWESPFYQYANRLAHLYYLAELNDVDAYLLFLYFADAADVPEPCGTEQWGGAIRLTRKCLGLGKHALDRRVGHVIVGVKDVLAARP